MQNFVKSGDNATVVFPAAVASGAAILIGPGLFGVAPSAVGPGAAGALLTTGQFTLPKAAVAMPAGAKLYWDTAAFVLTTDNTKGPYVAGVVAAAAAGDAKVLARLNGVAI